MLKSTHLTSRIRHAVFAGLIVSLVAVVGCGNDYLRTEDHYADEVGFVIDEEAEIPDTVDARQVVDVLVQYRRAVVRKDVGTLRRLVSERYYDNGGTTDTTRDDYAAESLPEVFELMAQNANQIKYDVKVKGVEVGERTASIDYEYEYAYQYQVGEQTNWDAGIDVNRLQLEAEEDGWKIVSGL